MVKVDDFNVVEDLYYSKDWMWVKIENGKARIGITDYAQKQLREVVFAELPDAGSEISKGEAFGSVESVKSVSDLIAPLSGKIEEVNDEVRSSPEKLNEDPYGDAWLLVVSPNNLQDELKSLMNFEASIKWHKELSKEN